MWGAVIALIVMVGVCYALTNIRIKQLPLNRTIRCTVKEKSARAFHRQAFRHRCG
jgi:hypothetical protein